MARQHNESAQNPLNLGDMTMELNEIVAENPLDLGVTAANSVHHLDLDLKETSSLSMMVDEQLAGTI